MEMLWAYMIGNEEKLKSPAWHDAVLFDRKAALKAGKISVSDWAEAKVRIKKKIIGSAFQP